MRSILIIFGLAFSLVITPANAEESRNYLIGYIVTWVDLCNYFRGYTVDRLRIKAIREAYEDDKEFQRGYKRERRLFSADTVMGLGDCEEALGYFAGIDVQSRLIGLIPQEPEVYGVSFSSPPKIGEALSNRELELAFIRYYKVKVGGHWSIEDVTKMVVTRITEDSIELDITARLVSSGHWSRHRDRHFIAQLEKFGSRYTLVNVER